MNTHFAFGKSAAAFLAVLLAVAGCESHTDWAAPDKLTPAKLRGEWNYHGMPCAIFQEGSVLLVVNERGSLATAVMTDATSLVIKDGRGWDIGLVGRVVDGGRTIAWENDTAWTRKQR